LFLSTPLKQLSNFTNPEKEQIISKPISFPQLKKEDDDVFEINNPLSFELK
jgi:hypothetical protein